MQDRAITVGAIQLLCAGGCSRIGVRCICVCAQGFVNQVLKAKVLFSSCNDVLNFACWQTQSLLSSPYFKVYHNILYEIS